MRSEQTRRGSFSRKMRDIWLFGYIDQQYVTGTTVNIAAAQVALFALSSCLVCPLFSTKLWEEIMPQLVQRALVLGKQREGSNHVGAGARVCGNRV